MLIWLKNVFVLTGKELKSLFTDVFLVILMCWLFTVGLVVAARGVTTEVNNAPVAVIDHDHSELSRSLISAIRAPYFQEPVLISDTEEQHAMDIGLYAFVIDIPTNFEEKWLKGENPEVMISVDATSMTLAGSGTAMLVQIIDKEIKDKLHADAKGPIKPVINTLFNSNTSSVWSMGLSQIVADITLLTLILTGAAVIRERERGTIEHLLVMPVTASEIAMAKIAANGLVILMMALIALVFVVHFWLSVPILGSVWLFTIGTICYLFTLTSLGILLAIFAPSMPQFGLLCLPVYIVMYLLSGAISPLENMPLILQKIMVISPAMQYSAFAQDVVFRGADLTVVYPRLIYMSIIGSVFLILALWRFRSMLSKQG